MTWYKNYNHLAKGDHNYVGLLLIPRPSLRETTSVLAGSCCCFVLKPSWSTVGIKTAFTEFLVLLEPPILPNVVSEVGLT